MTFAYDKYENLTGAQQDFSIGWSYIDASEVKAKLDGTEITSFTLVGGGSILRFSPNPVGNVLEIYRETDISEPIVEYSDDTGWLSTDLNNSNLQTLQAVQEARDLADRSILREDTLDFQGVRGENVGDPINATDAANKQYVDTALSGVPAAVAQAEAARDAAQTAQTGAETAETNAETAETNAEAARDKAQQWAEEAEDVEVDPGLYSAKHWAAKAEEALSDFVPASGGTFTGEVVFDTTDSVQIPVGTTAQRPGSPTQGALRFNSTDTAAEIYDGTAWSGVGGGGGLFKGENGEVGSAPGDIFRINEKELNTNVTIDADENASCAGPLTVATGVTLTVSSGGRLAVI